MLKIYSQLYAQGSYLADLKDCMGCRGSNKVSGLQARTLPTVLYSSGPEIFCFGEYEVRNGITGSYFLDNIQVVLTLWYTH